MSAAAVKNQAPGIDFFSGALSVNEVKKGNIKLF
jgi:hypothetical protein